MGEPGAELELFGREDAVQAIAGLLDGGGSTVVVGAPGSGKTTLLKAAARIAARRCRRVLTIAPTRFEQGLPFAGLAELISQCPDEITRDLPAPQRHALTVAVQLAEPEAGEANALAVLLAVRGVLTRLCQAEPVALLVDDLQWLDPSTVGAVGFAIRADVAPPQRLSVLIATRPDPVSGTDLLRVLTQPRRDVVLRPLDDAAIGQLLRARLGPRWTPPVSAGVARASAGNPLHALEIARALQERAFGSGALTHHGHDPVFPVPTSLAGLLTERVRLLPQAVRNVLLPVSAAGRLTLRQLQALVDPDELASVLEAAADAEVVVVGAESMVDFTHPMLSSALYNDATPAERRRVHRALAEHLEDPVQRARHRAKSIAIPDEAVAAELERAAEISQARGALQLAGELLEAAALATVADPQGGGGFDRWFRAAGAYLGAGDEIAAHAALDKGAMLATEPVQQAQVALLRVRLVDDYHRGRVMLETAFRLAPADSALRAQILGELAGYHRMEGHGRLALRLTHIAMALAVKHGRADIQVVVLNARQVIERLWDIGEPEETHRALLRLSEIPGVQAQAWIFAWARAFFAPFNDESAEQQVRKTIADVVDAGIYAALCHLYGCLLLVLIRHSKIHEAQAALDESDHVGAWTHYTRLAQEDFARVLVGAYAGDLDNARALAQRAIARPHVGSSTYWRAVFLAQLGFVEVSAGNWQEALGPLRELAEIFTRTAMVDLEQLLWAVDYADAALQNGSPDEVERAIEILCRQAAAGRHEASAAAQRCHAMLSAARGQLTDAIARLREIVGRPEAECPFEAARSQLALGQLYRRAGYKATAAQTLNAAAHAFAELGAPRWAERARSEAGRVGLHPTTDTLTATEQRVAELVAKGRSNQETADELFMSIKTVEANLTRIYRKLSVRSRTELANRLAAMDAAPE